LFLNHENLELGRINSLGLSLKERLNESDDGVGVLDRVLGR
jgi:hypothetical protein